MSKDVVPNPPAFPSHAGDPEMTDPRNRISCGGMTLRDWFAGQALPEVMRQLHSLPDGWTLGEAVEDAYGIADAMLRARLPAAALAAIDEQGE